MSPRPAARRVTGIRKYDPQTLFGSSLVGWWRADDLSGQADGTGVSAWADRSSNANTVTQATSGNQPTKQTDGAGLNCVRFASASQQNLAKTSPTGLTDVPGPLTVIVVNRPTVASGHVTFVEYAAAGNKGFVFGMSGTNYCVDDYVRTGTSSPAGNNSGVLGVAHFEMRSASTAAMLADNRLAFSGPTNMTWAAGATRLVFGGSLLYNQWYWNGDIYEIIYVNRLLTATERDLLSRNYLGPRYSLTMGTQYNASAPLTLPTYDGSGQVVHPDVYVAPTTWNGFKYWMAMTPYPGNDATFENPSIVVSNDNSTWSVPSGLTNPIDPNPGGGQYNSDCDLFLSQDGLTMYLVFRAVETAAEVIYIHTSTDGVTWSAKSEIARSTSAPAAAGGAAANQRSLSPTIVYFGGKYWMWTVRTTVASPVSRAVDYWQSNSPTTGWAYVGTCTMAVPTTYNGGDAAPWHIDVEYFGGQLYMLVNDNRNLFLAKSGDGISWTVAKTPVLRSGQGWDTAWIYRSSASLSADGQTVLIWYSAAGTGNNWRTGFTSVPVSELSF